LRNNFINENLINLYNNAGTFRITNTDRFVIFSDIHLGNGSRIDDFRHNESLFSEVLMNYYNRRKYNLVLNGDIEELQKFSIKSIHRRWSSLFEIFDLFDSDSRFLKIYGNHDFKLLEYDKKDRKYRIHEAVKLIYNKYPIFIFHGHQATVFFTKFYSVSNFFLKYFAAPLKIKNFEASHSNAVRYITEKRVYSFSSENRIISIIGHTHRPLFESLTKIDCLKFEIEQLCRIYTVQNKENKERSELLLKKYIRELKTLSKKKKISTIESNVYNSEIVIPCIFNSGCVIGKSGITGIEITSGIIRLVHWFDKNKVSKYLNYNDCTPEELSDTDFYRVVLKEDHLDYIFSRINLLN
jgi:UDP-2,3-diacylglucosamine pyrophosphatase LpxH